MFGGGGRPPEPKGDIRQLWSALGIDMVTGEQTDFSQGLADAEVIWQDYNPYQNKVNVANITPEWVFITPDAPGVGDDAFNNEDGISSGLSQLLFLYPGAVRDLGTRGLDFTPLVMTGDESGQIEFAGAAGISGRPADARLCPQERVHKRNATSSAPVFAASSEASFRCPMPVAPYWHKWPGRRPKAARIPRKRRAN